MGVFKTIGGVALHLLAIISVFIIIAYAMFIIFVDPETIGVNNVGDQLALDIVKSDDLTEEEKNEFEERWFMEANYYSNAKGNGLELRELKYNYFMSPKLLQSDYRASGMQTANKSKESYPAEYDYLLAHNSFYYYDTVDGISYSGYSGGQNKSVQTILNRDAELIIKIDNRPFVIQLTGKYETGWWIFKSSTEYTYHDVFDSVFKAIKTNSAGYGDYYITLDLSYYFSIYELNEKGQVLKDDVTDIIKNYAVLKFHYDENGAVYSNQSMFGKIENNSKYDKESVNYWSSNMVYTLTEKDFHYRYVEEHGGYYLSIPNNLKVLFAELSKHELNVELNLNSLYLQEKDIPVIGIDFNGLSGLNIDTLTITGKPTTFKILDGAFSGSTLKTLRHSKDIEFSGDFGIDYLEVIV